MNLQKVAVLLSVLFLVACGGSSGSQKDVCDELLSGEFSCDNMLNDLVDQGVKPIVQDLEISMIALDTAVESYCADISNGVNLAAARDAWTAVMVPLQKLQVMNFGPNEDADTGLLPLYDWQTAHPANIDKKIAKNSLFENVDLPVTDNEKDLVAIEYILFDIAAIQAYAISTDEPENVKNWRTGKTTDEIQQDRCDYAELVSASLETQAIALNQAWQQFDVLSSFNTKQAAVNKVVEALFYVDKVTKDLKIKDVLPQTDEEASGFDATNLESQFAKEDHSSEFILNNLMGAMTILTLNDSDNSKVALNDYLIAAGQDALGIEMQQTLTTAIANVMLIQNDLHTDIVNASDETVCLNYSSGSLDYLDANNNVELFCSAQHNVKMFTDVLKFELALLTGFTVPSTASGDVD